MTAWLLVVYMNAHIVATVSGLASEAACRGLAGRLGVDPRGNNEYACLSYDAAGPIVMQPAPAAPPPKQPPTRRRSEFKENGTRVQSCTPPKRERFNPPDFQSPEQR